MEQATPNPLDSKGLCLLSLDGGGVRGLSTLYILKGIIDRLNHERKMEAMPPVKPCEVFDLIGGTSTGGLIAIMLGRLEMDVDTCITAYSDLAAAVFDEELRCNPVNIKGHVKQPLDSERLENAIKNVIVQSGASETDLLNDGTKRGCQTFVCSIDNDTKNIVRLRSYSLPDEPSIRATICQAALATSAATGFFNPVSFGDRTFTDGRLSANNPVDEVEGEAANIWCSEAEELQPLLKCFISIGTGIPGKNAFENSKVKFLGKMVVQITTETEAKEKEFIARWLSYFDKKRYFRFNVEQGLQNIGLQEYNKKGNIEAASEEYLTHMEQKLRMRNCIDNLRLKQSAFIQDLSAEYCVASRTEAAWIVPFQRNPHFVGRSAEIAQVDAMLSSESRCERVAIIGLGGVGKTQIALEFAYRLRERQPDCSVFWIPVTNVDSMLEAYVEIGQQLRIPSLGQKKADIGKLVQHRLSLESSGSWLLVFDNADNIDPGCRINHLPKSKRGSILFTTRSRKAAIQLAGKNLVSISEMDEPVANGLLAKSLINPNLLADRKATIDLLQKLTYHPLAIIQAAAYINENKITLAEYTALLDDTEQHMVELLSEDFEDEGRYVDSKNPVGCTWLLSFEQIRNCKPLAAEYLSFMSCIDAKNIPQSLLPLAESAKKGVDAIGMLIAYSFITKQKEGQLLDLHPLVHLAARNWLRANGTLRVWEATALARLEKVLPDNDHTNRSIWRMYLPHARYALKIDTNGLDVEKAGLLWKFAGAWGGAPRYVSQHGQPGVDLHESRAMEGG
ncbi:kinase subdomain-containing protein [Pyrenochaeta sp. MPI-SDFR-AT-0127]|nr:kinase subdomain-containing protein [Pyrenochaeta sp. MPI-SDFR-AT-0127]